MLFLANADDIREKVTMFTNAFLANLNTLDGII